MSADFFLSYLECFFNDLGIKTWLNNRFNSERFGSENMFMLSGILNRVHCRIRKKISETESIASDEREMVDVKVTQKFLLHFFFLLGGLYKPASLHFSAHVSGAFVLEDIWFRSTSQ